MGKILGLALAFIGGIISIYALNMATNTPKSDVINIGLLNDQQNFIIIGCALFIAGVISFAADEIIDAINPPKKEENKTS